MINYSKYLLFACLLNAASLYAAHTDKENEEELSDESFKKILDLLKKPLKKNQVKILRKRIHEGNISIEPESPPKKRPVLQPIDLNQQHNIVISPSPEAITSESIMRNWLDSDDENSPVDHSVDLLDPDKSLDLFDNNAEQEQPQQINVPEINNLIDEGNDEKENTEAQPALVTPTKSTDSEDSSAGEVSFNIPKRATPLFSLGSHCAYVSPNPKGRKPPKGIIYIGNAVRDYQENRIALEDRLDLSKIFSHKKMTEENLFPALLKIERHLLVLIKENPKLVSSTVYVGQTKKTLRNRAAKHKNDFKNKGNMTKCKTVNLSLNADFDVRLSWLTENLFQKEYLNIVEILVGDTFIAQGLAGSAVLGDEKAHSILQKYYAWSKRKTELKKQGLDTVRENLGKILFENKVNAANLDTVNSNSDVARKLF